jgi:hypothetical protein
MPVLVHLADEKDTVSIRKNGIKIGKRRQGVFFMPVLPNFYVSHQWLRELKRNGAKTFIGVYFKLDSKTLVFAGKYNQAHKQITLGEAIKEIMSLEDPLGYELIIDRKIEAKEIEKIKHLPQKIGWRYFPNSHTKELCVCPICIVSGSIKSKKLRDKFEPKDKILSYIEILEKLRIERNEDEIDDLLWLVRKSKRKADPNDLSFLLEKKSNSINQSLALTLGVFKHKNTKSLLIQLLKSGDEDTRDFSTESLLNLYGKEIETFLIEQNDPIIQQSIDAWYEEN